MTSIIKWALLLAVAAGATVPGAAASEMRLMEALGKGTPYETTYFIYRGGLPGPAVLVEGGIHGDELSGTLAIDRLLPRLEVKAGKLILLPCMNKPACDRKVRFINVDLNRVFGAPPTGDAYEYRLAAEITEMIGRESIQHLLTLHDSKTHHDPLTQQSYGQSICYGVKPAPDYLQKWIDALNQHTVTASERFSPFYSPIKNSSTEFLVEKFKLKGGFCGETWLGLTPERRIALQESMILTLLDATGVVYTLKNSATQKNKD